MITVRTMHPDESLPSGVLLGFAGHDYEWNTNHVLVVERDNTIVGCAMLYIDHPRIIFIEHIAIDPACRGGEEMLCLMAAIRKWVDNSGARIAFGYSPNPDFVRMMKLAGAFISSKQFSLVVYTPNPNGGTHHGAI